MTRRTAAAILLAAVLGFVAGHASAATSRQVLEPSGPRPVVVASATSVLAPAEAPQPLAVGSAGASLAAESGGTSTSPEPVVRATRAATPGRTANPRLTTPELAVTGTASWYCSATSACTRGYPASGLFAAAGPALRVGAWRGRVVTVNGLRVRLVDWCGCPGGRVIDLYASVVTALGLSLSRGIYTVRVTW